MAMDHTNCTHPRTPAGRRVCRNGAGDLVGVAGADYIAEHIRKTAANGRFKARMDREYATRIQPRRSGARVSATSSTCVQAALHVDAHGGRCACGWEAEVA